MYCTFKPPVPGFGVAPEDCTDFITVVYRSLAVDPVLTSLTTSFSAGLGSLIPTRWLVLSIYKGSGTSLDLPAPNILIRPFEA